MEERDRITHELSDEERRAIETLLELDRQALAWFTARIDRRIMESIRETDR